MNTIKKYLGIVWMALAVFCAYNMHVIYWPKFFTGKQDDLIAAIIIYCILMPLIVLGLMTFGWYALTNEYED
jgi:hypothetical protein